MTIFISHTIELLAFGALSFKGHKVLQSSKQHLIMLMEKLF